MPFDNPSDWTTPVDGCTLFGATERLDQLCGGILFTGIMVSAEPEIEGRLLVGCGAGKVSQGSCDAHAP